MKWWMWKWKWKWKWSGDVEGGDVGGRGSEFDGVGSETKGNNGGWKGFNGFSSGSGRKSKIDNQVGWRDGLVLKGARWIKMDQD